MMLGFKMFNYSETVWIAITVSNDNAPLHELIPCFKILFNRGRQQAPYRFRDSFRMFISETGRGDRLLLYNKTLNQGWQSGQKNGQIRISDSIADFLHCGFGFQF